MDLFESHSITYRILRGINAHCKSHTLSRLDIHRAVLEEVHGDLVRQKWTLRKSQEIRSVRNNWREGVGIEPANDGGTAANRF